MNWYRKRRRNYCATIWGGCPWWIAETSAKWLATWDATRFWRRGCCGFMMSMCASRGGWRLEVRYQSERDVGARRSAQDGVLTISDCSSVSETELWPPFCTQSDGLQFRSDFPHIINRCSKPNRTSRPSQGGRSEEH